MKILGLIPARGGSKGIPGKNIKRLNHKPLIAYTIESAFQSSDLSKVVVSTDDEAIARVATDQDAEVPFLRPKYLAKDHSGSLEVVLHALDFYLKLGEYFDAVCLLQPTSPFRDSQLIDACIEKFICSSTDSLVSVREVPHEFHPDWVFLDKAGKLKIATGREQLVKRRQDLAPAYYRDGAVYLVKSSVLLEQKSLYGQSIGYYVNTSSRHINLDTLDDWEKAERMLCVE